MIDWLEIKQFAIAEHIALEFETGFTAVTGETGSGKSLIVDAVGILLGHRGDASFIRHRYDTADLQAGFKLHAGHSARQWLENQGMDTQAESLILRRVLRRNKSSRGYINGVAVTATQLREIGRHLVDIHGQNEHHSLLQRSVQLNLLDNIAGNMADLENLGKHFENITNLQNQIDQLLNSSRTTQERADLLRFQLEELGELSPAEGEWQKIAAAHKKMNHLQEIVSGTADATNHLAGQDSVLEKLNLCINQLGGLAQFDATLQPIIVMLQESQIVIDEAAEQLYPYHRDAEVDGYETERIEQRFALYHSLSRKHRMQPDALFDCWNKMQLELKGLADPEGEIAKLEEALKEEVEQYNEIARALSKNRKETATRLSLEVTQLMHELGMQGGQFLITLHANANDNSTSTPAPTRYGLESAEFMVTANRGVPLQALSKVASGGELSRISLAMQVVLSSQSRTPTLIFDEVDVGIGGEVAHTVGDKLKRLGETAQVICVTHLPQVAAQGQHQFSVSKDTTQGTRVTVLNEEQRINEIARMSGGDKISERSLAHAQELLQIE